MTPADGKGPRPLGDILGSMFATRGLGRLRAAGELEEAWASAAGDAAAAQTKVGAVRHGVLTVTVAHPALLEELSAFRKADLLASLRRDAPASAIQDIRFRVGPIDPPPSAEPPARRPRRKA